MFVVMGASGNTGHIVANNLLTRGQKVRVIGRNSAHLQPLTAKGAEPFIADVSDAIAGALQSAGTKNVVALSSVGAELANGSGPVVSLHNLEEKLKHISGPNVLFLRAAYFMENTLPQVNAIRQMGVVAGPLRPDLKIPMIATRDIGAVAADTLLHP